MFIKNIKVKNFKSFKELDVDLGQLNVFIGANASGKSNFVQLIRFFRDFNKEGFDNALSLQGGIEYFKNINLSEENEFKLEISFEPLSNETGLNKYKENNNKLIIDNILFKFNYPSKESYEKFPTTANPSIITGNFSLIDGNRTEKFKIIYDIFGASTTYEDNTKDKIIIENLLKNILNIGNNFKEITTFEFDLKAAKEGSKKGKADLEEDAGNLALVLDNILKNEEKKRKFLNLLNLILPFAESLNTSKHFDGSKVFNLKEKYNQNELPSFLLSDGTISITALIVALYFENKPIIIFEEPDRGIHPHLISETIEMFKEASQSKQIIFTTHNPEVLKHVDLDNIYLVSRDKEGFSQITKPANSQMVKEFLHNELGISDLFIDNMLEL